MGLQTQYSIDVLVIMVSAMIAHSSIFRLLQLSDSLFNQEII